jgi:hypothetical protein
LDEVFPASNEPARSRYARSNGVALHRSWQEASARAHAELVERDHILRAWYGWELPERVCLDGTSTSTSTSTSTDAGPGWAVERGTPTAYEWRAYRFGVKEPEGWMAGIEVRGVFGLPRTADAPFIAGYGARRSGEDALAAARAEAAQLLAFLWGEPLPTEFPPSAPHAGAHLERLLYPGQREVLRRWLEGAHTKLPTGPLLPRPAPPSAEDELAHRAPRFADLTQPFLSDHFAVAAALHPRALRLVFGEVDRMAHLPPELRLHPVA